MTQALFGRYRLYRTPRRTRRASATPGVHFAVLKTDAFYRELADKALQDAGIVEPPVDMKVLAELLGVPVRHPRLPGFFSGMLVYEEGMPVFVVNATRDEPHQRATLAHMIGHVIAVLNDEGSSYPRNTADHHPADVIGAELVLPEPIVASEARKWFNDYRYLARLFAVTEGEMMEKMQALGIIKDRGIRWDY